MANPRGREVFSGDWLSLREAIDHESRDHSLAAAAAEWLDRRGGRRVLDLGAGTGSNTRYLAPRLHGPQQWLLLDHDAALLAQARSRCEALRDRSHQPIALATKCTGLADLSALSLPAQAFDLITASALLDLVSEQWLNQLAELCLGQSSGKGCAALLMTLSYDGHFGFGSPLEGDELVRECVNAHQRGPKGFGAALGPDAPGVVERVLKARGFSVKRGDSSWHLDHRHAALQAALIGGWSEAATAQAPAHRDAIHVWRDDRLRAVAEGRSEVHVGHQDLFATAGVQETSGP